MQKMIRFLTGTDEHGQKIQKKAEEKGMMPQEYVDKIVAGVIDLWKVMEISYDDFIRTIQPRHVKRVQAIFNTMYEKGDIYKSQYEGLYYTPNCLMGKRWTLVYILVCKKCLMRHEYMAYRYM